MWQSVRDPRECLGSGYPYVLGGPARGVTPKSATLTSPPVLANEWERVGAGRLDSARASWIRLPQSVGLSESPGRPRLDCSRRPAWTVPGEKLASARRDGQ